MRESPLTAFIRESNMIEGILRKPSKKELAASHDFLNIDGICIGDICTLQEIFAPGKPLRDKLGMDVRVGNHVAPSGGMPIVSNLITICASARADTSPWIIHVAFETLHPFMDGNGRTGRMLWAWMMRQQGEDPFAISFLHRFYYQTLANSRA